MTAETVSMKRVWERILRWYSANISERFKEWADNAPGPATVEEIRQCEQALGMDLPDSVRESYLVCKGGGDLRIFPYGDLCTLSEIVEEWELRKGILERGNEQEASTISCHRAIRRRGWDKKWIPFTESGSGDHYCIDMNPSKYGSIGQIFRYDHEQGPKDLIADSFSAFLSIFADHLEQGKYRWSDAHSQAWPVTGSPSNAI